MGRLGICVRVEVYVDCGLEVVGGWKGDWAVMGA